ncbi:MAG TPA: hypothetical protein VNU68_14490, partial [Verrucomicrobiae bacterium]|nr:hypothetical protein [Verrucomicrobiae bacterium]
GERAGVRGEKAKSFEFPKVRFMGSWHLLVHANWGLELKSNVAAEVTRYTLSLSKGSDLFPDERATIE